MVYAQTAGLRRRIRELTHRDAPLRIKILEDISQFMSIDTGDVLRLDGNDYRVTGNAREGRFGIDDQPKFWVKSAIDLTSGMKKIIKGDIRADHIIPQNETGNYVWIDFDYKFFACFAAWRETMISPFAVGV